MAVPNQIAREIMTVLRRRGDIREKDLVDQKNPHVFSSPSLMR